MKFSRRYAIRAGTGFGITLSLLLGITLGIGGFVVGLALGALFGLLVFAIVRSKERIWETLRVPYVSEGIVHEGPAACSIGPGFMLLTEKRLVWLPTAVHDRNKLISIAREAIAKVDRGGMSSNLRVGVRTGESVEFLVRERKQWLKQLQNATVQLPQARVV